MDFSVRLLGPFIPFGEQSKQSKPLGACYKNNNNSGNSGNSFILEERNQHEEELYVSGNRVIWSAGKHTLAMFTAPTRVLQVARASFKSRWHKNDEEDTTKRREEYTESLCVLHEEGVAVHHKGSLRSAVAEGFDKIWALPHGLILEKIGKHEDGQLFGLMHPLESVVPVRLHSSTTTTPLLSSSSSSTSSSSSSSSSSSIINSSIDYINTKFHSISSHLKKIRIIFVSREEPLVVAYNVVSHKHVIYEVLDTSNFHESYLMACTLSTHEEGNVYTESSSLLEDQFLPLLNLNEDSIFSSNKNSLSNERVTISTLSNNNNNNNNNNNDDCGDIPFNVIPTGSLSFRMIYEEECDDTKGVEPATTVFMYTGRGEKRYICLIRKETPTSTSKLFAYNLLKNKGDLHLKVTDLAFCINDVVTAYPVSAARSFFGENVCELLVAPCLPLPVLHLYSDGEKLYTFDMSNEGLTGRVVGMRCPVANRINLIITNEKKEIINNNDDTNNDSENVNKISPLDHTEYRIAVKLVPYGQHVDLLIRCIIALDAVLPSHILNLIIQKSLLSTITKNLEKNDEENIKSSITPWQWFVNALIHVLFECDEETREKNKEEQNVHKKEEGDGDVEDVFEGDYAWEQLLCSEYHKSMQLSPIMHQIVMKIAPDESERVSDNEVISSSSNSSSSSSSSSSSNIQRMTIVGKEYGTTFIRALHILYENDKVNVLCEVSEQRELAGLLIRICKAVGWYRYIDHYLRDFSDFDGIYCNVNDGMKCYNNNDGDDDDASTIEKDSVTETSSDSDTSSGSIYGGLLDVAEGTVPSIYRWVHHRLQQFNITSSSSSFSSFIMDMSTDRVHLPPTDSPKTTNKKRIDDRKERIHESLDLDEMVLHSLPSRFPCNQLRHLCLLYNELVCISPQYKDNINNNERGDEIEKKSTHSPPAHKRRRLIDCNICHTGDGNEYDVHNPSVKHSSSSPFTSSSTIKTTTIAQRVVQKMVSIGFGKAELECVPFGLALPLREAIRACRYAPRMDWGAGEYALIDRDDLYADPAEAEYFLSSGGRRISSSEHMEGVGKMGNKDSSKATGTGGTIGGGDEEGADDPTTIDGDGEGPFIDMDYLSPGYWDNSDADGTRLDNDVTQLLLGSEDLRLREVRRVMSSGRPIPIKPVTDGEEGDLSDHEQMEVLQVELRRLATRNMAKCCGRGMLTLASVVALVENESPIVIPPLVIDGRTTHNHNKITYDRTVLTGGLGGGGGAASGGAAASFAADGGLLRWPAFHNGVAAALRLSVPPREHITSTWIVYNRPGGRRTGPPHPDKSTGCTTTGPSHAGFLMGLGLRGLLNGLAKADIIDYLQHRHEATTMAILIGLAATCRGTMDESVAKVLSIHFPSLYPPSSTDLQVPPSVITAAMLGIGLLYENTADRRMTEVLLEEIDCPPTDDRRFNREAHALTAGLALGMVTLGKGGTARGLSDLYIEDRLKRYLVGGQRCPSGVEGTHTEHRRRRRGVGGNSVSSLRDFTTGSGRRNDTSVNDKESDGRRGGDKSHSSSLAMEGPLINIEVTGAAAALALGLMYIRTGNTHVAGMLAIPQTRALLDDVRPDLLFLRTVSRNLVMWDEVGVCPPDHQRHSYPITTSTSSTLKGKEKMFSSGYEEESSQKGESSQKEESFIQDEEKYVSASTISKWIRMQQPRIVLESSEEEILEEDTLRQCRMNVRAGACFVLGLRFAGTQDMRVHQSIGEVFHELRVCTINKRAMNPPQDYGMMDTCLDMVCLALGLVMAGSGHLTTFTWLRSTRNRKVKHATYGNHMARHMAIGFLFLGGGRYTLTRTNSAIAALLTSLYLRFPSSLEDERYHLQVFRHMYVLACERRCIEPRDVDTRIACSVPLYIELKADPPLRPIPSTIHLTAPALIPELHLVRSIGVVGGKYYTRSLHLLHNPAHLAAISTTKTLFVKRITGYTRHHQSSVGNSSSSGSSSSNNFPINTSTVGDDHDDNDDNDTLSYSSNTNTTGSDRCLAVVSPVYYQKTKEEFVHSFSTDPAVLAFVEHFCTHKQKSGDDDGFGINSSNNNNNNNDDDDNNERRKGIKRLAGIIGESLRAYCSSIVYECLSKEKIEMMGTYMNIYDAVRAPPIHPNASNGIKNIAIIVSYYDAFEKHLRKSGISYENNVIATDSASQNHLPYTHAKLEPLLEPSFVLALRSRLLSVTIENEDLKQYMKEGIFPHCSSISKEGRILFGTYLSCFGIPDKVTLDAILIKIKSFNFTSTGDYSTGGVHIPLVAMFLPYTPPHIIAKLTTVLLDE